MANDQKTDFLKSDIRNLINNFNFQSAELNKDSVRDELLSFIESDMTNDEVIKIYNDVIKEYDEGIQKSYEEEVANQIDEDNDDEDENEDDDDDNDIKEPEVFEKKIELDKKVVNRINNISKQKNDEMYDPKKFAYSNSIGGKIAKAELRSANMEIVDFNNKENLITEKILDNPKEFLNITKSYGLNISERGIELIVSIIKGISSVNQSITDNNNIKTKRNDENLYFAPIPNKNGGITYQPTVKFATLMLFFTSDVKVEMVDVFDKVMADGTIRIFVAVKITDKIYNREIVQICSEPVTIKFKDKKTGEIIKEENDYDKKTELAYSKAFRNGMVKLYGYWTDAISGIFTKNKK